MADETTQTGDDGLTTEKEARNMGWLPQDQWQGDPEKWISAEDFVERGKNVLPILTANNRKLQMRLDESSRRTQKLEEALQASQEAIQALQEHYSENTKRQIKQARENLIKQIAEARESGDFASELALQDELSDLREVSKKTETVPQAPAKGATDSQEINPETAAWIESNKDWFGVDREKTEEAYAIGEELRRNGDTTQGSRFFAKISLELERRAQDKSSTGGRPASKVDSGGTPTGHNRQTSSKSYASLPPEAKDACMSDAKRLVGANRAYKTVEDWQAAYAKIYYGE